MPTSHHLMVAVKLAVVCLLIFIWMIGVDGDVYVKDLSLNRTIKKYDDLQASFGLDFPNDGLEGWIVYASPDPNACSPVRKPPINETKCNETVCNYILLIARGGLCEFSDKVLAAQYSGYDAVIVHNFPGNNSVVEMQSCSNGSRVNIPSTFVGYSNGMELLRYNYTTRRYIIRIYEDDYINFPKFLWPFLLAMTICILVALVFLLVKLLREHASKKLNRLSRKHLKKIPVRKFKKGDYYDTCAICLDEYEEGEKIRVLPCDHVYHMKCIDPWLTKNKKTCPVCKRRVIPGRDGDSESDSETEGGRPVTAESENTPLLGGGSSGPSHSQSHGSIVDPVANQSPGSGSSFANGGNTNLLDSDLEHGAVGGEGISDRNKRQQSLLSQATSSRGSTQEKDERRERRRKRRVLANAADENDETAGLLVGSETRTEQKEKRKQRKDKKKRAENRQRHPGSAENAQAKAENDNEAEKSVSQQEEVNSTGDQVGHDNPVYSDSHEVVVPMGPHVREMNNVV